MRMLQNAAMFPDATVIATTQPGAVTSSSPQKAENSGVFAKVLEVSRSSSGEAANETAASKDVSAPTAKVPASSAFAYLKRQSSVQTGDPRIAQQLQVDDDGQQQPVADPEQSKKGADAAVLRDELQRETATLTAEDALAALTAPAAPIAFDAMLGSAGATVVTAEYADVTTAASTGKEQQSSGLVVLATAVQAKDQQGNTAAAAQTDRSQEQLAMGEKVAAGAVQERPTTIPLAEQKEKVVEARVVAAAGRQEAAPVSQPAAPESIPQQAVATARPEAKQADDAVEPVARRNAAAADRLQAQSTGKAAANVVQAAPRQASAAESEQVVLASAGTVADNAQEESAVFSSLPAQEQEAAKRSTQTIAAQDVVATAGSNAQQEAVPTAGRNAQREVVETTGRNAQQEVVATAGRDVQQEVNPVVPGTRQSAAAAYRLPEQQATERATATNAVQMKADAVQTAAETGPVVQANAEKATDVGSARPLFSSQLLAGEQKIAPAPEQSGQQTAAKVVVPPTGSNAQQATDPASTVAVQGKPAAADLPERQGKSTATAAQTTPGPNPTPTFGTTQEQVFAPAAQQPAAQDSVTATATGSKTQQTGKVAARLAPQAAATADQLPEQRATVRLTATDTVQSNSSPVSVTEGAQLVAANAADSVEQFTQVSSLATELKTAPTAQPAVQPTVQPEVQIVAQSAVQPTVQPEVQIVAQPAVQPTVQPEVQTVAQPAVQPTVQPEVQTVAQPAVQPTVQSEVQTVAQPVAQPVAQSAVQPTVNAGAQPAVQSPIQPAATQPAVRPAPQVVVAQEFFVTTSSDQKQESSVAASVAPASMAADNGVADQAAASAVVATNATKAAIPLAVAEESAPLVMADPGTTVENRQSVSQLSSLQQAGEQVMPPAAQQAAQVSVTPVQVATPVNEQKVVAPVALAGSATADALQTTPMPVTPTAEAQEMVVASTSAIREESSPVQLADEQEAAPAALHVTQVKAARIATEQGSVLTTTTDAEEQSGGVATPVRSAAVAETVQAAPSPIASATEKAQVAQADGSMVRQSAQELPQAQPVQAAREQAGAPALQHERQAATQDPVSNTAGKGPAAIAPGARQSAAAAYLFPEPTAGTGETAPNAVPTAPSPVMPTERVVQVNQGMTTNQATQPSRPSADEQHAALAGQQTQSSGAAAGSSARQQSATTVSAAGQGVDATQVNAPIAADRPSYQATLGEPAREEAPREVNVSVEKAKTAAATGVIAEQRPVQAAISEAVVSVASSPDKVALAAADQKSPRTAEGAQRPQATEKMVAEQVGAPSKLSEEASGTTFADAEVTARVAPLQGGQGQAGSGEADKKGHPEQKAQHKGSDQAAPVGFSVQPPVVVEAEQVETKPTNLKSALQESVFSQIKDGVVTLDGKGNGQMSIRLNPGELGELKIEVRMEDNRLKVEVQAENKTVKDLLMNNLENLKEALSNKNLNMERFDVSTGGNGFNRPMPEEKRNPRQQMLRTAKAAGYPGQDAGRVNYLTGAVNNLLDVRF